MKQLEKDFKLCGAISGDLDIGVLYSNLMGNVQTTIQYNMEQAGVMNVTDICAVMVDDTADYDAYNQFVKLSALYLNATGSKCDESRWNNTVAVLASITKDANNNMRPWTYQTCAEFGYYQTTDSITQPFHSWKQLNVKFFQETCAAAFNGWSVYPYVAWTNDKYGAQEIDGTNIAFTGGTIDPWHAEGVTNATNLVDDTEVKIYMLGTAHCRDLFAPLPDDSASLKWAHSKVEALVGEWLAISSEERTSYLRGGEIINEALDKLNREPIFQQVI